MTDKQLRNEILAELEFEPEVHPERIGVSVEDGVVALAGHVDSCSQKLAAERVVKRVYSARAIVNDLEVRLPSRDQMPDTDLAQAVIRTIDGLTQLPPYAIRVTVRDGHVTLEGAVEWQYQRDIAVSTVQHLRGVRGVLNHIALAESAAPEELSRDVIASLRRSADQPDDINVEYSDGKVVLRGSVSCLRERDEAERTAWRARGVFEVDNRLTVVP